MHTLVRTADPRGWHPGSRLGACLLAASLLFAFNPRHLFAQAPPPQAPPPAQPPPGPGEVLGEAGSMPTYTPESPEQLQQLVAPIALYPDSLVAEVLAASTFPEEAVEADRWLQANPGLTGQALAQAVNQQPWDASVKALTAFPSVLGNMDKNLSWTSSLGDAYYNQPQAVMAAVQAMRQRAQAAGTLQNTPQQVVTDQGPDIEIEPSNPDVVYVPAYDPWAVYGAPIYPWPGWYTYPGIWFGGPYLSFGIGFPIGFFGGFGWGWQHWGFNWGDHYARFGGGRYFSRSATFFDRRNFYSRFGAGNSFATRGLRSGGFASGGQIRGGQSFRAGGAGRFGASPRPFGGDVRAARGYAAPRGQVGMRSGAFSGFSSGGETRGFSARGRESFGGFGGGGFRGGGGGFRGGGGRR